MHLVGIPTESHYDAQIHEYQILLYFEMMLSWGHSNTFSDVIKIMLFLKKAKIVFQIFLFSFSETLGRVFGRILTKNEEIASRLHRLSLQL